MLTTGFPRVDVVLLEAAICRKLGVALGTLARPRALLGFTAHKVMLPQEALDHRDTDLDAMIGGQAVGNLLVREVGPLDGRVHGRTGRVILQHLEKGRVQRGDPLMTRLAAATFATDARLLAGPRDR